jgi:hypothetical protein
MVFNFLIRKTLQISQDTTLFLALEQPNAASGIVVEMETT